MVVFLATVALAQDTLTLPLGRAAVLALETPPTSLSASNSTFRVEQLPPYLVLLGVRTGEGTFRLTDADGSRTVSVSVPSSGQVSGKGFVAGADPIVLPVDHGYLLPLPDDVASHTVVRPSIAQVVPFGERWLWVQGAEQGVTDVIVESRESAPSIWTLNVGTEGAAPAEAHPVTGSFAVPVGGTLAIDLGTAPVGQIVGHPSRITVRASEAVDKSLELVGRKAGTTWLVTGHADGAIGVYRIEVTADETRSRTIAPHPRSCHGPHHRHRRRVPQARERGGIPVLPQRHGGPVGALGDLLPLARPR